MTSLEAVQKVIDCPDLSEFERYDLLNFIKEDLQALINISSKLFKVVKCLKSRLNLHQGAFDDTYYYLTFNVEKSQLTESEFRLLKGGFNYGI